MLNLYTFIRQKISQRHPGHPQRKYAVAENQAHVPGANVDAGRASNHADYHRWRLHCFAFQRISVRTI